MLARVEGFIRAKDKESFIKILKLLSPYIVENNFINKSGETITEEPNIDEDYLYIEIPYGIYSNMSYIFDHNFVEKITKSSDVIFTSNDNCFVGGYIRNGEKQFIFLEKWATKNINKKKPSFSDINNYKAWQNMVIQDFVKEYT